MANNRLDSDKPRTTEVSKVTLGHLLSIASVTLVCKIMHVLLAMASTHLHMY